MQRPNARFNPAAGLLRIEQFQIAYATNDVERARLLFHDRYGIKAFRRLEPLNEINEVVDALGGKPDIVFECAVCRDF